MLNMFRFKTDVYRFLVILRCVTLSTNRIYRWKKTTAMWLWDLFVPSLQYITQFDRFKLPINTAISLPKHFRTYESFYGNELKIYERYRGPCAPCFFSTLHKNMPTVNSVWLENGNRHIAFSNGDKRLIWFGMKCLAHMCIQIWLHTITIKNHR